MTPIEREWFEGLGDLVRIIGVVAVVLLLAHAAVLVVLIAS